MWIGSTSCSIASHSTHVSNDLPATSPPPPCIPNRPPSCQIYDAAVKKVPEKERLSVYDVYVARASEFFGIGKVRASIVRAASCCLLCCRQPFACAGAAA